MAKSKWKVDADHTGVDFTVRHMVVSKVRGSFKTFDAEIEADPADLTTADISFAIGVASVDTRNDDRDNHLRSADFFDAENHPQMTFKSTSIVRTGDNAYDVTGDLTIRGVTRPETFRAVFEGQGKDPWGNEKAVFSAEGKIDRTDYGLKWNAALETGGVLVSEQVQINLDIQAFKQA